MQVFATLFGHESLHAAYSLTTLILPYEIYSM